MSGVSALQIDSVLRAALAPLQQLEVLERRRNRIDAEQRYQQLLQQQPDAIFLPTRMALDVLRAISNAGLRDAEGRLLLAGPFPAIDSPDPGPAGFSGSLIVAEFASHAAATAWADADPYVAAGVYQKVLRVDQVGIGVAVRDVYTIALQDGTMLEVDHHFADVDAFGDSAGGEVEV